MLCEAQVDVLIRGHQIWLFLKAVKLVAICSCLGLVLNVWQLERVLNIWQLWLYGYGFVVGKY